MKNINCGLEGVVVNTTKISFIDGINGQLVYRGYDIEDLTDLSYEAVSYLLLFGTIPTQIQLKDFNQQLVLGRKLPSYAIDLLKSLPKNITPIDAIRTVVSCIKVDSDKYSSGIDIIAKMPVIAATAYNILNNKTIIKPRTDLAHSANYLYMLKGQEAEYSTVNALDKYLITTADHGMNASTFTARIVSSTESDLISSVIAAISALKGPLHGGAPSEVEEMLNDIKTEENIEPWLEAKIANKEKIMGFGHRVYKTYDPRAALLRKAVKLLGNKFKNLNLSIAVERKATEILKKYKPEKELYPNVEFWAAAILRVVNLPKELYTPTFAIGRISGWVAQILEQLNNNRLVRPTVEYVGELPLKNLIKNDDKTYLRDFDDQAVS